MADDKTLFYVLGGLGLVYLLSQKKVRAGSPSGAPQTYQRRSDGFVALPFEAHDSPAGLVKASDFIPLDSPDYIPVNTSNVTPFRGKTGNAELASGISYDDITM